MSRQMSSDQLTEALGLDGAPIVFTLSQTRERDGEGWHRYGCDITINGETEVLVEPMLDGLDAAVAHELAQRGLDINNARFA